MLPDTKHTFRPGYVKHQGFSAEQPEDDSVELRGAHSATIPCLYTDSTTRAKFVFLYRSGFYDESNATIDILKEVNDADSSIDGHNSGNKLRKATINLLNKAAQGDDNTPEVVTKLLVKALIKQIEYHQGACKQNSGYRGFVPIRKKGENSAKGSRKAGDY